ncbi:MAG: hypothetical protein NWF00_09765 [Candidatus Bathyarchaeota archaeon]|nr:hypothetical protein [Candidatus Bathyarchaeota archaeon]
MTKTPDMKEIERKTYMSYHQDGLLDIFIGVYVLGFGLGIVMDAVWELSFGTIMPAILIAIILPLWIALKRKITMPRIGFVKFGPSGSNKLMAVLLGLMVAGLGVLFVFTLSIGQRPQWLNFIYQNGLLVIGVGALAVCALFGYTMGLKRLYGYGLLTLCLFMVGHFLGIFFAYLLLALGTAVIVTGFYLLMKFMQKYPLQGDRALAD